MVLTRSLKIASFYEGVYLIVLTTNKIADNSAIKRGNTVLATIIPYYMNVQ